MKKILFLVMLGFGFMSQSFAAVNQGIGKINILRTHDQVLFPNHDWITLDNFSSAGNCGTYQGAVVLIINTLDGQNSGLGERMYANILLAKGGDKRVRVGVDDTYTSSSGYCYIRWLNIED